MSDYTLLLVPTKGRENKDVTMVKVESRHVSKVPVEGNVEVAFDTTIDPTSYQDHIVLAGELCRLVADGRAFHMAKERIRRCLNELDDILTDLKSPHSPPLADETENILFDAALSRVQEISELGFGIVHPEGK